jgi:hypothetical protein
MGVYFMLHSLMVPSMAPMYVLGHILKTEVFRCRIVQSHEQKVSGASGGETGSRRRVPAWDFESPALLLVLNV